MIKNIPCIIFAGGKSSRMGEDKALLPFAECETLTQYQLKRLSLIFKEVLISCKSSDKFDFEANFIEDDKEYAVSAPTLGFYSALQQCRCEAIFVLSVDSPFVGVEEIEAMISSFERGDYEAVIAKTKEGIHPLCGVYSFKLLKTFRLMLEENNHRLGQMLKNISTNYIEFENEDTFANLNHPHEYQRAIKHTFNITQS